jgi:hypothetical protein
MPIVFMAGGAAVLWALAGCVMERQAAAAVTIAKIRFSFVTRMTSFLMQTSSDLGISPEPLPGIRLKKLRAHSGGDYAKSDRTQDLPIKEQTTSAAKKPLGVCGR